MLLSLLSLLGRRAILVVLVTELAERTTQHATATISEATFGFFLFLAWKMAVRQWVVSTGHRCGRSCLSRRKGDAGK